ncbi:MAG: hypothetical protein LBU32_08560 [Clostridiales bacterium]|jgi:hypothetical protein|nr:hypothetical protein [Clostridiales bacterium]
MANYYQVTMLYENEQGCRILTKLAKSLNPLDFPKPPDPLDLSDKELCKKVMDFRIALMSEITTALGAVVIHSAICLVNSAAKLEQLVEFYRAIRKNDSGLTLDIVYVGPPLSTDFSSEFFKIMRSCARERICFIFISDTLHTGAAPTEGDILNVCQSMLANRISRTLRAASGLFFVRAAHCTLAPFNLFFELASKRINDSEEYRADIKELEEKIEDFLKKVIGRLKMPGKGDFRHLSWGDAKFSGGRFKTVDAQLMAPGFKDLLDRFISLNYTSQFDSYMNECKKENENPHSDLIALVLGGADGDLIGEQRISSMEALRNALLDAKTQHENRARKVFGAASPHQRMECSNLWDYSDYFYEACIKDMLEIARYKCSSALAGFMADQLDSDISKEKENLRLFKETLLRGCQSSRKNDFAKAVYSEASVLFQENPELEKALRKKIIEFMNAGTQTAKTPAEKMIFSKSFSKFISLANEWRHLFKKGALDAFQENVNRILEEQLSRKYLLHMHSYDSLQSWLNEPADAASLMPRGFYAPSSNQIEGSEDVFCLFEFFKVDLENSNAYFLIT